MTKMYAKSSPIPATRSPLLKPHSETLLCDIHTTETSASFVVDADILASQNKYLSCAICERILLSKAGKVNHEKSCVRNILREKRERRYKLMKKPRVYTCKDCGDQFNERNLLNKHVKSHISIITCSFCHEEFQDRMEFEIHDAINDGKNYELLNYTTYRTRSQSRLSCNTMSQSIRSQSCDGNYYNGHRSPASDFKSTSSRKRASRPPSNISLSFPAKKSREITDWIENNRYISVFSDDNSSMKSFAMDRSISPVTSTFSSAYSMAYFRSEYLCSEANCLKSFPTLKWVTVHEMREHKKLPLFSCRECRNPFTTSGNLYLHRINAHPDVLNCVLCDHQHKGIEAIDEHLYLHQKFSIACEVCGKTFLSKFYLDEHIKYNVHRHKNYAKTKASILVRIDRRETSEIVDVSKIAETYSIKLPLSSYEEFCPSSDLIDSDRLELDDLPWRS